MKSRSEFLPVAAVLQRKQLGILRSRDCGCGYVPRHVWNRIIVKQMRPRLKVIDAGAAFLCFDDLGGV